MARPLFSDLSIFQSNMAGKNLVDVLNVTTTHESILMFGRYNKLNR